ncbi:uncharacterized protein [Amphiura filiformis]|uniref:uncharacterized protein n=1 Tax=Amphiura filiformis TaxID=82378 RepID=UPI003B21389C
MGLVSYAWFPLFAASSAVGLGVARYFYPLHIDGPPLFPLCHYIVDILYLTSVLSRYIYVDKVQATFWNGFSMIVGLIAVISYICSIQLVSSRTLVREYGLQDEILEHIEKGLLCLTPFATNLYFILQTVVSYKTKGSSRYTGPCMKAARVIIAVILTPVAHYLIFTHVTTYILELARFGFLVDYYPYVYWGFGGLTSLYTLSLASELSHIKSYCGCVIGKTTAKVSPLGMIVTTEEAEDGITTIDTKTGRIYVAREFTPLPPPRKEDLRGLSYVWLPLITGLAAVGLFVGRYFTGDLLTVTPMFPYLDHAVVAALFLLTIIVRCAHVRKVQPCFYNGIAIVLGLLAIISQTGLIQLPITPIPIPQIGLNIVWIMLGLQCLLPLSTSLYCILQTVVSFKTKIRLGSGKFIRAQRVFVSIFVTLAALYIILTHALPYLPWTHSVLTTIQIYLVLYYQYAYWAFEALIVFFIIGFANEFSRIAMCFGCCKCTCCKKRQLRRIHPMIDDESRPMTRLSMIAEGSNKEYHYDHGCFHL